MYTNCLLGAEKHVELRSFVLGTGQLADLWRVHVLQWRTLYRDLGKRKQPARSLWLRYGRSQCCGQVHYIHKPSCWFYSSATGWMQPYGSGLSDAFADAGNGVVGNGTRNSLNSPATDVFDAALIKDFPSPKGLGPSFGGRCLMCSITRCLQRPSGDVSTGAAAQITSLSGDPRVMQFALRVDF